MNRIDRIKFRILLILFILLILSKTPLCLRAFV
jgi:hypothetical protein